MLDIHLSLMLTSLVIFLFLIYQLNQLLYTPLLRFMKNRDEAIARDLESAKNLSDDSDELLAEAKKNIEEARAEASKIRLEAIESAKEANEKAYNAKLKELEAEYEKFQAQLKEEQETLKSAILSQLPLIREGLKAKFSKI